jgi:hypothetical protein
MLIGGLAAVALLAPNALANGHPGRAHQIGPKVEMAFSGVSARQVRSATGGAPAASSSVYVYGAFVDFCGPGATTGCPLYNDGANAPVPASGGLTVLDFGAPCFEPATLALGTQLFNSAVM